MGDLNLYLFSRIAGGFDPYYPALFVALKAASWGASLAAALVLLALWKKPADRVYLLAAVMACALASVLAHVLAASFALPRPFMLGMSPVYMAHGARGSFPSAHAATMFTLAAIFSMRQSLRIYAMAMAMIALLTSWGRIYVGLHFPLDIVGGAVLAVLISAAFGAVRRAGIAALAVPGKAVLEKRKA